MTLTLIATANTENWGQVVDLGLAFLLSAAIGVEREIRQKSAGLRTHTLVGVGAALFMLVSKYGFSDVFIRGEVILDPSRMAAQIVSGVGFLGAGLIFVRSDAVRGLTTAAAVWLTAAVGCAAGAALPGLAVVTTLVYFVVVIVFPAVVSRLPRSSSAISVIKVTYIDGRGVLRDVLSSATSRGFAVAELASTTAGGSLDSSAHKERAGFLPVSQGRKLVEVTLKVHGTGSISDLAANLTEIEGVHGVLADDVNSASE